MGTRGRVSTAALTVVGASEIDAVERPQAPAELTPEQKAEWYAIVNRMPADWFPRETHSMLAQYCRHIVRARRLGQLLDKAESAEDFDVKEYRDLLRSEEEQSRAISSLATKMRISQQTTYDKSRKKGSGGVRKPWE